MTKYSKAYVASWIVTYLLLQITRIVTIISTGLLLIGEMDVERFNFAQIAGIKIGALIIGFILISGLNRIIEAVEDYCHRKDI